MSPELKVCEDTKRGKFHPSPKTKWAFFGDSFLSGWLQGIQLAHPHMWRLDQTNHICTHWRMVCYYTWCFLAPSFKSCLSHVFILHKETLYVLKEILFLSSCSLFREEACPKCEDTSWHEPYVVFTEGVCVCVCERDASMANKWRPVSAAHIFYIYVQLSSLSLFVTHIYNINHHLQANVSPNPYK